MKKWKKSSLIGLLLLVVMLIYIIFFNWGVPYTKNHFLELLVSSVVFFLIFTVCVRIILEGIERAKNPTSVPKNWVVDTEFDKALLLEPISTSVKKTLKSPISAVFCEPEELEILKNKDYDYILVMGYVQSQNSFGAMIKTNFKLKATNVDGIWKIIK